jgi:hypothetical protein
MTSGNTFSLGPVVSAPNSIGSASKPVIIYCKTEDKCVVAYTQNAQDLCVRKVACDSGGNISFPDNDALIESCAPSSIALISLDVTNSVVVAFATGSIVKFKPFNIYAAGVLINSGTPIFPSAPLLISTETTTNSNTVVSLALASLTYPVISYQDRTEDDIYIKVLELTNGIITNPYSHISFPINGVSILGLYTDEENYNVILVDSSQNLNINVRTGTYVGVSDKVMSFLPPVVVKPVGCYSTGVAFIKDNNLDNPFLLTTQVRQGNDNLQIQSIQVRASTNYGTTTPDNFIGITSSAVASGDVAEIDTACSVNVQQSNLDVGRFYYLNPSNNSLTTNSAQPLNWGGSPAWAPAGKAVTSSGIIVLNTF